MVPEFLGWLTIGGCILAGVYLGTLPGRKKKDHNDKH